MPCAGTLAPQEHVRVHIPNGFIRTLSLSNFSWGMDLDDLEKKAASSTAKVLLLSHMRSKASIDHHLYCIYAILDIFICTPQVPFACCYGCVRGKTSVATPIVVRVGMPSQHVCRLDVK